MYHNVIRQQNLLTPAFLKVYLVCGLITAIISLTGINLVGELTSSPEHIMVLIFPRYLIFSGLMPTYLLSLLPCIQPRVQDVLLYQSRKIITLQILYRVSISTLLMAGIWSMTNITVITVSGAAYLLKTIWLYLLIRIVYLWLACFLLGMIAATIVLATKSKLMAFFVSFGICGLSFFLVISHLPSLFFDFSARNSNPLLLAKGVIMLGLVCFMIALLTAIVNRRDL